MKYTIPSHVLVGKNSKGYKLAYIKNKRAVGLKEFYLFTDVCCETDDEKSNYIDLILKYCPHKRVSLNIAGRVALRHAGHYGKKLLLEGMLFNNKPENKIREFEDTPFVPTGFQVDGHAYYAFDPRGFKIQISSALYHKLYINPQPCIYLGNKGYVSLHLLDSPDYKDSLFIEKNIRKATFIGTTELELGRRYLTTTGDDFVYVGKFYDKSGLNHFVFKGNKFISIDTFHTTKIIPTETLVDVDISGCSKEPLVLVMEPATNLNSSLSYCDEFGLPILVNPTKKTFLQLPVTSISSWKPITSVYFTHYLPKSQSKDKIVIDESF